MKNPFSPKVRHLLTHMVGDCDDCGHSIAYHLPWVGCTKCNCDEFS
jgi:hypothetical protein